MSNRQRIPLKYPGEINQRSIDMIKKTAVSMSALILGLGMFAAVSVNAQPTSSMKSPAKWRLNVVAILEK